jgi:hypothetical protein
MITIKIDKKKYKGIYSWDDITLQKFYDLASIEMPEGYESYIKADGDFSTENIDKYVEVVSNITDKQISVDFPIYYRRVIRCLTNIPTEIIAEMSNDRVNEIYEGYFKPFVVSLVFNDPKIRLYGQLVPYYPPQIRAFFCGWSIYWLPKTVRIMDQDIALAEEPVVSYIEASDILRGIRFTKGDIKRLALFMAIYCRKRGERYEEKKSLMREAKFMNLPMSTVWSVFFYTLRRLPDLTLIIRLFGELPKPIREAVHQARNYRSLVTVH